MRILMISDVYFPRVNGVSTSIKTFRDELQKMGHKVVLIVPNYGNGQTLEPNIVRVASRSVIGDPEDRMMKRRDLNQAIKQLESTPFDLVHIHTPFVAHYAGVRIARMRNIPCVESYHTLFEEYLYHYIPYLPKRLLRYVARYFTRSQCAVIDALISPSGPMRQVLQNYGVTTRTEIIPTGMQINQFVHADGARFRQFRNIDPQRPTLVHVGRIAHEKNIDFLIRMLQRVQHDIPNVLMILAGEGPALTHIKDLSRQLNVDKNILFVGYLSRDRELLDCYVAGDVFVFASKTETQGLVLLEAMALGVPVVSTAYLGTRDILDCGRGALVAKDDLSDFSGKVMQLLNDPDLRMRLGEEGRRYAAAWSATRLAERLCAFYSELCCSEIISAAASH